MQTVEHVQSDCDTTNTSNSIGQTRKERKPYLGKKPYHDKKPCESRPVTNNGWDTLNEATPVVTTNYKERKEHRKEGPAVHVPANSLSWCQNPKSNKDKDAKILKLTEKLLAEKDEMLKLRDELRAAKEEIMRLNEVIRSSKAATPARVEKAPARCNHKAIGTKGAKTRTYTLEEINEIHVKADLFKRCAWEVKFYEPNVQESGVYSFGGCGASPVGGKFCPEHAKIIADRVRNKALAATLREEEDVRQNEDD